MQKLPFIFLKVKTNTFYFLESKKNLLFTDININFFSCLIPISGFLYLVWIQNPPGTPKWVKDPGNELKSIRGSLGDHSGSILGVLGPFGGLRKARKPN